MKTWQFYLRLFRFQPLMYTINLIGIVGAFLLEMVPGLLTREYFNMLSGAAPARFGLATLIALLFAGALGRMFFYILLPLTNTTFVYTCGALLRKNMLARILQRPGARALPSSSGEAVSRFRDDIDETLWSVMYFNGGRGDNHDDDQRLDHAGGAAAAGADCGGDAARGRADRAVSQSQP